MLRVLKTGALLRTQTKNIAAAVANYSALPQPQTAPEVLYTGVSVQIHKKKPVKTIRNKLGQLSRGGPKKSTKRATQIKHVFELTLGAGNCSCYRAMPPIPFANALHMRNQVFRFSSLVLGLPNKLADEQSQGTPNIPITYTECLSPAVGD